MVETTIRELRAEKDTITEQKNQLISAVKKQALLINQEDTKKKLMVIIDEFSVSLSIFRLKHPTQHCSKKINLPWKLFTTLSATSKIKM